MTSKRVRFEVRRYEDVRSPFDLAVLALGALGLPSHFDIAHRIPEHLHKRDSYQGGAKRVLPRTWETVERLRELGLVAERRAAFALTLDGRELVQRTLHTMPLRDLATCAPPLRARAARFALLVRAADSAMRNPAEAAPSVAAYACTCAGCTAIRIGYAIGLEARRAVSDRSDTVNPCRPGAWGSLDNCAVHHGYELDETGRCIDGRPEVTITLDAPREGLAPGVLAAIGAAASGKPDPA